MLLNLMEVKLYCRINLACFPEHYMCEVHCWCVVVVCSFSLLYSIFLQDMHSLLTHFIIDEKSDYSQFLIIKNNATVNIIVHTYIYIYMCISFACISRNGIA